MADARTSRIVSDLVDPAPQARPWLHHRGVINADTLEAWRHAAEANHRDDRLRISKATGGPTSHLSPGISVIIPSHRGRDRILRCLDSLAEQTLAPELFEVIVVLNGPADGTAELLAKFHDGHPALGLRIVTMSEAGASKARNAGIAAAARRYTTFIDDDDFVSPKFLEVLLAKAQPGVIPMASVVDVRSGEHDASNYINSMLVEHSAQLTEPVDLRVATSVNAAKAVATELIKGVRYDEELASGEDIVFWMTVVTRNPVRFLPCPADWGATYYRVMRDNSVSRKAVSFDFHVRQRLDVVQRLQSLVDGADERSVMLLDSRIRGQSAFINDYLLAHPDEHSLAVALLDDRRITRIPYDRINRRLARGLVVAYAFPPYADTSAVVMAKRVRAQAAVVDVISNAMDRIREHDDSLRTISGPFTGHDHAVHTPTYFSDWGSMEQFAVEGMRLIRGWEKSKGGYQWLYSRAHFAASHFLAAAYKLTNPGVKWIAEFSDPLSRDIHDHERGTPVKKGRLLRDLRVGLRQLGLPIPQSNNCFVWCEEVAYALADEIIFTNENQRDYMLEYCSDPDLAQMARAKATIAPHPTLPSTFYRMVERDYPLEPDLAHLAYFGNFYATRGLDDVLGALADLEPATRMRLRIHVFTSKPAELKRRAEELGISNCVQVGPYVRFLEFLNLTTKFDCLIVNDATTGDSHKANPYLPSKWSDYRGSGTPVWGLVEPGSPLSSQPLDYTSPVGDIPAAREVLAAVAAAKGFPRQA